MSQAAEAALLFKSLIEIAPVRALLRSLAAWCPRDGESAVDVALELMAGERRSACAKCRMKYFLLSRFIRLSANFFGASEQTLGSILAEPHYRRALASVVKGIAKYGARVPFVPGAPFQVVWNVTKACNLRCAHCYECAGSQSRELNTREAIEAIDILADAGVVILAFSGGEPTLRPDIVKLVSRASERGMYVAMATNGTMLADAKRVRELRDAGLGFVQISLDGLNPETHDSFRGVPGSWEMAVQAIRNCAAEGLFVEVAATVTKRNLGEVLELARFARSLGANWFMIYNFVPTGRGAEIAHEDLSPDERRELLEKALKLTLSGECEVLSTAPQFAVVAQEAVKRGAEVIPTHFYNPRYKGKLRRLAEFIGGCGAGRFYVAMEPNGDIYPCVFFARNPDVRLGNILENDFEEIWDDSELLWKLRDKDSLGGACGTCKYRYTCGGCRARAYAYFGDPTAPDPGCWLNREFWNAIVRGATVERTVAA